MAHLLIIELPGGNDIDILQAAIARGDQFTFVSAQLSHYKLQPAILELLTFAYEQIELNPFSYEQLEKRILQLNSHHKIDAILCLIDLRLVEAAKIAEKLQLPFLNVSSAILLRDKFNVRRALKAKNIPQPDFRLATSNDELKQAVDELGLPVLIKPADGYGSQNIVVLRHPEDLDPLFTPLDDMLPSRADYGLGVMANDRLLIERFMEGTIIGCDTITQQGVHQLLGVNEKLFFAPPSFAIRGGVFTPNNGQFKQIEQYLFALLDAVNFNCGATHTEMIITAEGLQLVEINARLVGAKIPRIINYALERSIHNDLIDLHLGKIITTTSIHHKKISASRWIVTDEAGTLENIQLPTEKIEHICMVDIVKKIGDKVKPPYENVDRIGCVMACADSIDDCNLALDSYMSQLKLFINP